MCQNDLRKKNFQEIVSDSTRVLTFMLLDPHSLVDGVGSPTIPLTTFSIDSPAVGELISIDDLQKSTIVMKLHSYLKNKNV